MTQSSAPKSGQKTKVKTSMSRHGLNSFLENISHVQWVGSAGGNPAQRREVFEIPHCGFGASHSSDTLQVFQQIPSSLGPLGLLVVSLGGAAVSSRGILLPRGCLAQRGAPLLLGCVTLDRSPKPKPHITPQPAGSQELPCSRSAVHQGGVWPPKSWNEPPVLLQGLVLIKGTPM